MNFKIFIFKETVSHRGNENLPDSTLIILNLPPCSGVENPDKHMLFWNQKIMQN